MTAELNDAELIALAVSGEPVVDYKHSNSHAVCDYNLPAIVRGFLAINLGSATETIAIEEAGFMPKLYGRKDGKACRVIMVSSLGDVGIAYKDVRYGYSLRCSIYDLDLDAFTLERPTDLPDGPPQDRDPERACSPPIQFTLKSRRRGRAIRTRP